MSQSDADRLSSLNAKERSLSESLIRLRAERESLEKELKVLSAEAIEGFGTDDIEALRERYKKAETENIEKLDAYEAALNSLSESLSALKAKEA